MQCYFAAGASVGFGAFGSHHSPSWRYLSIAMPASRPAPAALMTVAAPVTMSPPAKTPFLVVRPVFSDSTRM